MTTINRSGSNFIGFRFQMFLWLNPVISSADNRAEGDKKYILKVYAFFVD
jgi:hypothetical protein